MAKIKVLMWILGLSLLAVDCRSEKDYHYEHLYVKQNDIQCAGRNGTVYRLEGLYGYTEVSVYSVYTTDNIDVLWADSVAKGRFTLPPFTPCRLPIDPGQPFKLVFACEPGIEYQYGINITVAYVRQIARINDLGMRAGVEHFRMPGGSVSLSKVNCIQGVCLALVQSAGGETTYAELPQYQLTAQYIYVPGMVVTHAGWHGSLQGVFVYDLREQAWILWDFDKDGPRIMQPHGHEPFVTPLPPNAYGTVVLRKNE